MQVFMVNFKTSRIFRTFHKKISEQIQPCDFRGHSHFRNQIQKLHFRDDKTGARRRGNVPEAAQHWFPDPVECSPSRDLDQGPGAGLPSQHSAQGESTPDTALGPL